jgi:hypothetical protein
LTSRRAPKSEIRQALEAWVEAIRDAEEEPVGSSQRPLLERVVERRRTEYVTAVLRSSIAADARGDLADRDRAGSGTDDVEQLAG